MFVLMFSRYFRYSLAQRVESTRTRGDRSINSSYSRVMLTIPSLLKEWKNDKEKKRNLKVIGEEGDESDVKIEDKWFGKQIEKKMKLVVKKMKIKVN